MGKEDQTLHEGRLSPCERQKLARKLVEHARGLIEIARSMQPDTEEIEFDIPVILDQISQSDAADGDKSVTWRKKSEREYRARRFRDQIFNSPGLFGEPAWDILLDIMAAEMHGKKLSVTSACIGACVPSTTALRWLSILETRGLVQRESDSRDGRRAFIRMSPDGFGKMVSYFTAIEKFAGA